MLNLLRASYRRMFKSKLLYLFMILMFLIVLFYCVAYIMFGDGVSFSTDQFVISFPSIALIPTIGIAIYVFGANFIGKDFEYLTIKNKIIVGNSKIIIYLINLLVVFSAGMLFYLAYYLSVLTIGMGLIGKPFLVLYAFDVFKLLAYQVLLVLTYAAVTTSVVMITKNKMASVVILIVLGVILMTVGYSLISRLNEPEYWTDYDTGELIYNSSYIKPGFWRTLLTFIVNFFPSCSSCYFMVSGSLDSIPLGEISIYAAIFIVIFTGMGIYLFNKSNLK